MVRHQRRDANAEFYAFEVRESGGGYQFLTKKDYYQTVAQLNGEKFLKRLSTAALETLAIIAYKQPISKGEIEHIRGVSSDYSIQKLLEKELIVISGRSEELPGKPLLYTTSKAFMDYFGLNSPADLPKLKEVFDEEVIQPTLITDEAFLHSNGNGFVVSETGELLEDAYIPTITIHEDVAIPEDVEESETPETPETGEPAEPEAPAESTEAPLEDAAPEQEAGTEETPDLNAAATWGGDEDEEEEEEEELDDLDEYDGDEDEEEDEDDEEEDEDDDDEDFEDEEDEEEDEDDEEDDEDEDEDFDEEDDDEDFEEDEDEEDEDEDDKK
ncbi:MAG TPA: SMC-Scp complex subunit ScpB [Chitinophaga sp.]